MSKMKELLISGNVSKDFKRLGVEFRETYRGDKYSVCEVNTKEFEILCDEPDIENTWVNCGWRWDRKSNQGKVNSELIVNNKTLKCWYEPLEEDDEGDYKPDYSNLLEYLEIEVGSSTFSNVCSCTEDLAKQNNMKLSELFQKYQD